MSENLFKFLRDWEKERDEALESFAKPKRVVGEVTSTIEGRKTMVTDIVTWEDIKGFMPEIPVFISAGTGRGKSHFIKCVLYKEVSERHEKILMIVNRSNISEQFRAELEALRRSNVVEVRTYQSLESLNEKERKEIVDDLEEYDYLVMDECQYFLDDAAFNNTTDISLDLIMRAVNPKKIFMSATGRRVKALIEKLYQVEFECYEIPDDFSHIQTLNFFNTYDDMEMKLEEIIKRGEKSIVFIQKAETAYKFSEKLGETAQFCCAKSNKHCRYGQKRGWRLPGEQENR